MLVLPPVRFVKYTATLRRPWSGCLLSGLKPAAVTKAEAEAAKMPAENKSDPDYSSANPNS